MSTSSNERLTRVLSSFEHRPVENVGQAFSPDEVRFRSLIKRMECKTVSRSIAEYIVGGKVRLQSLIEENKVRAYKPSGGYNKSWKINAADCYRHTKPDSEFMLNKVNDTLAVS